jgi:serine/threonine protein kinase
MICSLFCICVLLAFRCRDLKSLNILIDARWCAKISDFGLSRFKAAAPSTLYTAQCGTFHWMAPEVIKGHRYTEKADVYSFGINLWELLTRSTPFEGLQPVQVGIAVLRDGARPPIPPGAPPDYAALIQDCWQTEPEARPSFQDIIQRLKDLLIKQKEKDAAQKAPISGYQPSPMESGW